MKKFLFFSTSTAVVSGVAVNAFVRKVPVPERSLLGMHTKKEYEAAPENVHLPDLFEIYLKSPNASLDNYISSFVSSPVFRLERWILKQAKVIDAVEEAPTTYPVGQKIALWEVKSRDEENGEALLTWNSPAFPFSGATYLRISVLDPNRIVVIQFGSSLNIPPSAEVASWKIKLHHFYSKLLLLNTAIYILWNKK